MVGQSPSDAFVIVSGVDSATTARPWRKALPRGVLDECIALPLLCERVRDRYAEHRQDRVADERLHRPAVQLDDRLH